MVGLVSDGDACRVRETPEAEPDQGVPVYAPGPRMPHTDDALRLELAENRFVFDVHK